MTKEPEIKNPQIFNLLLLIICGSLFVIGAYQIYTNRLEDGLINLVISVGLAGIPFSDKDFSMKIPKPWQNILFGTMAVFVILATVYLLYLGFTS